MSYSKKGVVTSNDSVLKSNNNTIYKHFSVISKISNEILGYIICDSQGNIIEFSTNISVYNDYFTSKNQSNNSEMTEAYYQPGFHGVIRDNKIEPIEYTGSTNNNIKKHSLDDSNTKGSTDKYKLISGVPDYPYTISCIPTAIGNILGYWNSNGYPNLISGSYISMITAISNYMTSNTSNAYIPQAVHSYCHANGRYPNNFTATNVWNPYFSQLKTEIDANRPALIGFASGDAYSGAHMTACVGYYYSTTSTDRYIYVHDAWSSTAVNYYVQWSSYNDFLGKIVP